MADQPQAASSPSNGNTPREGQRPSPPSYSAWRTSAHLYLPLVTVSQIAIMGWPFETIQGSILGTIMFAILTNWVATFFYPTDRAEPTSEQTIRFSRKKDVYRAAILFTYRWIFGTPFDLQFFIADLTMSYGLGSVIGERPAGTKQRRSEFGVHLLWVAGNAVLVHFAPSMLTYWVNVVDRVLWRAAYIALVDDVIGVLARPNVKTWKGKLVLVLTQAFTIAYLSWQLLSWKRQLLLMSQFEEAYEAELASMLAQIESVEVQGDVEDDGDRFLV